MEKKRRVVVTGLGLVSCFGQEVDTFYEKLLDGESGISKIDRFDIEEYPTRFAGCVRDFNTEGYLDRKQARRTDPCIQYMLVAGKKAMEDAGLTEEALQGFDKKRCGVLIGTGMGGMKTFEDGVTNVNSKGFSRLSPFFIPYVITNMGGALLAIDYGFKGPNYSISTACATASHSIIAAAKHIQNGDADLMVCGGAEAPLTQMGVAGFVVIKALSTNNDDMAGAGRPWDKKRDGFVMGEGAGVLVLESEESALKRGARIYGEYLGGGISCDAHHMTNPLEDGSGVAQCIQLALDDASIEKKKVNYINAHATCTPVGDLCELRGIESIFKEQCDGMTMNATKAQIGHCLGAAGAMGSIVTIKAIETSKIPPTINVEDPEEDVKKFDIVQDGPKSMDVTAGLVNAFGFGGHNACIIFGPYER